MIETKPQRPAAPPIGRSAAKIARKLATKTGRVAPFILDDWASVVGPDLAGHCQPAALKGSGARRTLYIDAWSGPAAARIQFMTDIIASRLRERLGAKAPHLIRIRQTPRPVTAKKSAASRAANPLSRPLPKADAPELQDALARYRAAFETR